MQHEKRSYLSATEVAQLMKVTVKEVHKMSEEGILPYAMAASGQYRYRMEDIEDHLDKGTMTLLNEKKKDSLIIQTGHTVQRVYVKQAQSMTELEDDSVHLAITSPPYFNAKLYSQNPAEGDLGNIHALDQWYREIEKVWREVYRVLQPGRKFFLNIMNLPVKDGSSYRTLNLTGQTIDLCEKIGFIFKRDIVWHKTNGVRAHFGTYPYPGGILLNNMHEFILEFNKPDQPGRKKYLHVSKEQREQSRLDKDFWLSLKNSDVWLIKPENSGDGRKHIAPFPLEIPHRLIKAYSYVGELILDPFCGAGTTLAAAARLGRHGIGYEINSDIGIIAEQEIIRRYAESDLE